MKYKNKIIDTPDGRFHSKLEYDRWVWLKSEQKAGRISNLSRQSEFTMTVNGKKICKYIADFCFSVGPRSVVDDAKGMVTPTFRLKAKLFEALYGIKINIAKTPTAPYS